MIELAAAESPVSGGREVGHLDLDEMQAHAALLFKNADTIPAIEGGWIKPEIKIAPTGDVLLDRSFEQGSLQRTAEICHRSERDSTSDAQGDSGPAPSRVNDPGDALTKAIVAEFGVDDDLYVGFSGALVMIAETVNAGVFAMRRSELRMAVNGQDEQLRDLAPLIDRYTLPCRSRWALPHPGAIPRDYDLAKFDRRYSLIGRPMVAIDDDDDPLLVLAPGMVERAMMHNLGGALTGGLQHEFWSSPEMRTFASKRGDETGLAFNDDLADELTNMGLEAYASTKLTWCLNHQGTDVVKRLGDVDVLVFSPNKARIWA